MDLILLLIAFLITLAAQGYITSSYNKYKKVLSKKNISGCEVARMILDSHGLENIYVTETNGILQDHYDPTRKTIKLSNDIFHGTSIASCAVASHEVGHAIQDKENYNFFKIRSMMFPLVNFASYAGYFAIFIGILFGSMNLFWIGIEFEIIILLYQIVTLPVEFDASDRALKELKKHGILTNKELEESKTMLKAAALTYVAGVLSTILQILRLIFIFGNSNRRD